MRTIHYFSFTTLLISFSSFGQYIIDPQLKLPVEKAIEFKVVTVDLKPDSKFGTNEVGEFVSNFIFSKDDLLYFNNDNVHIGQSTIV